MVFSLSVAFLSQHPVPPSNEDVVCLLAKLKSPASIGVPPVSTLSSCSVFPASSVSQNLPPVSNPLADVSLMKSKVSNFFADDLFKEPLTRSQNFMWRSEDLTKNKRILLFWHRFFGHVGLCMTCILRLEARNPWDSHSQTQWFCCSYLCMYVILTGDKSTEANNFKQTGRHASKCCRSSQD